MQVSNLKQCPCCSGKLYSDCCESFIFNNKLPETALELMRSRYTAYVVGNLDYIKATSAGKALKDLNKNLTTGNSKSDDNFQWVKLEIIASKQGKSTDKIGFVEFKASFIKDTKLGFLHEKSKFKKISSKWFYISGVQI